MAAPMSDLERDLREKHAAGVKNPKPTLPVTIFGRDDGGPQERISRPLDQTGLPTNAASPFPPVNPMLRELREKVPVDYSRRTQPKSLDHAGVGPGRPPAGGFKVG
jgi:hypothetical protein